MSQARSLECSAASLVLADVGNIIQLLNTVRNSQLQMAADNSTMIGMAAQTAGQAAYDDAQNTGANTMLDGGSMIANAAVSLVGEAVSYVASAAAYQGKISAANNELKNVETWENNPGKHDINIEKSGLNEQQVKTLPKKTPLTEMEEKKAEEFFNKIKSSEFGERPPNKDEIDGIDIYRTSKAHKEFQEKIEKQKDQINNKIQKLNADRERSFDIWRQVSANVGSAVQGGMKIAEGKNQKDGAKYRMAQAVWNYIKDALASIENRFQSTADKGSDTITQVLQGLDSIYNANKS